MNENEQNASASVLDRLIDLEPGVSHEPVQRRTFGLRQIKAAVVRDLENLLNTRRHIISPPDALTEVNSSLLVYGLGDFTSHNPRSPTVKQQLRQDIERTISRFEPRLRNVTVQFESPNPNERNLRFRISGMLVVDPIREPITFDTLFDINRSHVIIAK
ncbi:MAG: type VI secretion system baseplate subunit TssE [Syntrophobacteraceae bacterium]